MYSRGFCPSVFCALMLAPCSRSRSKVLRCPFLAARCSGVRFFFPLALMLG